MKTIGIIMQWKLIVILKEKMEDVRIIKSFHGFYEEYLLEKRLL